VTGHSQIYTSIRRRAVDRRQLLKGAGAVAASAAGLSLAAPGTIAQGNPVTIRFAGWIGMEESTAAQFEHMVGLFQDAHPNVTIDYEGIAWENTRQQLLLEASSGNPPDVAQVAAPWIGQFAFSGAIAPLEELVADISADYVGGVVDSYTFPDATGESHLWGLPWVAVHAASFYNTELMRRASLDTAALPKTIDEFSELAHAIAGLGKDENGNKIWGFTTGTDRSELTANNFNMWLFNFGVTFSVKTAPSRSMPIPRFRRSPSGRAWSTMASCPPVSRSATSTT
jgi:ABC-type glycerol-3-phosphate transport system substrate-binding protein